MNFFKRLFSSNKTTNQESKPEEANFKGIHSVEDFKNRYSEDTIDPQMLDGCFKMIESYFFDNKIERKVHSPINHPMNLDQLDQDGFGFVLYCKAFQLGEGEATLFLALSFSDFLIKKYGFKLYNDTKPEQPLRGMTLKYDNDGVVLSLYPYEYTSKVLNGNETFSELEEKINSQIAELPKMDEIIKKYTTPESEN